MRMGLFILLLTACFSGCGGPKDERPLAPPEMDTSDPDKAMEGYADKQKEMTGQK